MILNKDDDDYDDDDDDDDDDEDEDVMGQSPSQGWEGALLPEHLQPQ